MIISVVDAKCDYPSACNAMETLLLHKSHIKSGLFDDICDELKSRKVQIAFLYYPFSTSFLFFFFFLSFSVLSSFLFFFFFYFFSFASTSLLLLLLLHPLFLPFLLLLLNSPLRPLLLPFLFLLVVNLNVRDIHYSC